MTSSYISPSYTISSNANLPHVAASRHNREDVISRRQMKAHRWSSNLASSSDSIPLKHTNCIIQRQVPLAKFTSFKVGGPAELYVAPRSIEELQASLAWADEMAEPVTLLGAGSNLLVSDRGLAGLVIGSRYLRHMEFREDTCQLIAGAGEPIARLAWKAAERGWSGLEWAAGIPGTVGGAVVMNAGAHKLCAADILTHAQVLSMDQEQKTLQNKDLGFQYRSSILQGSQLLITEAMFQLQPGHSPTEIMKQTRAHLKHRHTTQPYNMPSCGSVFRNPQSHSAGWLIEQTGLKGYQIGQAQVAQRHANFILNLGKATANDICNLIQHVQSQVERQWSLSLHPEVKLMGEF